jgi:hypothetical protein
MAVDLVDRLAILMATRRFSSMGAADSRSLRYESYAPMMKEFYGGLHMFPSVHFLGTYVVGSCLPPCSEGLGFGACSRFFFAGGFLYFLCTSKS